MTGLEYSITLDTGERVDVLELDPATCDALRPGPVAEALDWILSRCTRASRAELEDAKGGWCGPLQDALGTPPLGCLLKMRDPACSLVDECGIADRARCTTRNVGKGLGLFPVCWEPVAPRAGADLAWRIVHAWKEGRWVVIVTP